jgi:hypothetical protein
MTTAAAEYRSNIGHDCTLADAYDSEYLDADEVEDADLMSTERQRQALNARMAEWYGIS